MAFNMDALLRIAAKVTGGEQVTALQGRFKAVEGAAASLTSRVGPLGGALGALAPVATVSGLAALVGKTIEAGDAMNDLSQRTGVSVESLAQFKKAAATSGTDIDSVAKALGKLSKGLYEASETGKGPTAEALKTLGISAKDAAGNLKTADQVTLEIANKFKTMPDGVQKTAIAMQLFGKAGAEMIPLLNMGGDAIDKLKVKMTTAFAQKADEYKDKLTALSGKIGGLAAGITVSLLPALDKMATVVTNIVNVFTNLPAPIQTVIGTVSLVAVGITILSPLVTGLIRVLSALGALKIGAIITGWTGAVFAFLKGLAVFAVTIGGWPLLIGAALVAAGVLIFAFRDQIGSVLIAIGKTVSVAVDGLAFVIRSTITGVWNWIKGVASGIAQAISGPFQSAASVIRSTLNTILRFAGNTVNGFIGIVNGLINQVNSVTSRLRIPALPTLPTVPIPQFATGAYVTGATVAQIAEAGEPEYVIPASRMAAASQAYQQGARGIDVINGSRSSTPAQIILPRVQTGPVLQLPDGEQRPTMADLENAMISTAHAVMAQLGRPAARVALRGA